MPTVASPDEIRDDFDEIAALIPSRAGAGATERWLMRQLPERRDRALDIGCGVGDVARLLAREAFTAVDAIDLSDGMIAEARRRTPATLPIAFAAADMFEWLRERRDRYDCIVTIATLHHVDLAQALQAMSAALRPGGRLLVIDLYDRRGLRHLATNVLAAGWNVMRTAALAAQGKWSWRLHRAFREHGRSETYSSLPDVIATARAVLPGAVVSGTLLWRYTLVWQRSNG